MNKIFLLTISAIAYSTSYAAQIGDREAKEIARAIEESKRAAEQHQAKINAEYESQLQFALDESNREEKIKKQIEEDTKKALAQSEDEQKKIAQNTLDFIKVLHNFNNYNSSEIISILKEYKQRKIDITTKVNTPIAVYTNENNSRIERYEILDLLSGTMGMRKIEVVEFLIDSGIQVYQNHKGINALNTAVINKDTEIVDLLIKNKANLNIQENTGGTPIHAIATLHQGNENCNCNQQILEKLIAAGADVSIKDDHGKEAAQYTKCPIILSLICHAKAKNKKYLIQEAAKAITERTGLFLPVTNIIANYYVDMPI